MMRTLLCGILLLCFQTSVLADTDWRFVDIEGSEHRPFEDDRTSAVVVVFISTDCPIANSYLPLLQRMANEGKESGIRFFLVHPRTDVTAEQAHEHARRFAVDVPVIIDRDLVISRRLLAKTTPEAFVLTAGQQTPAYRGRIDNRYAGYGRKRSVATSSDLADAIHAVAQGDLPQVRRTKSVGCLISYPK
ncbi:MAG: redoxin domain-containing protein [Planctomycetaceae bacterium]|nr:redoxin domain-containing protein [Planctomycetaceae bacterium]